MFKRAIEMNSTIGRRANHDVNKMPEMCCCVSCKLLVRFGGRKIQLSELENNSSVDLVGDSQLELSTRSQLWSQTRRIGLELSRELGQSYQRETFYWHGYWSLRIYDPIWCMYICICYPIYEIWQRNLLQWRRLVAVLKILHPEPDSENNGVLTLL